MLSKELKEKIKLFSTSPIPSIYKTDNTDRILFVETVCFDVCKALLKNKRLSEDHVCEIMTEYSQYLEQTDISEFNDYALQHFNALTDIMELFVKVMESNI